jgi:hypothetical protein
VNNQIRSGNASAGAFWGRLSYSDDAASGMGKRLIPAQWCAPVRLGRLRIRPRSRDFG